MFIGWFVQNWPTVFKPDDDAAFEAVLHTDTVLLEAGVLPKMQGMIYPI
ncbi:hypothetical protein IV417_14625 [Alphaproteobacteria bacterium KMM 3653]|uniref:Uncharacterized protein n=1 Tax=Harenicola maris TaxID=2841044 RepID=A0AAP2CSV6_9RHOB|nr:hypothetical protein [Harenicola maris]